MHLFSTIVLQLLFSRKSNKKLMIFCSKIPSLMNFEIFTKRVVQHLDIFWDSSLQRLGSILFMPISTRAILLRKIGNHSGLILDGNLNRSSKRPTGLPQGLEVLSHNMVMSRSISSPGILFSTFPGGLNLLLLIQSLVTHLPSMMEVPSPSCLLERTF